MPILKFSPENMSKNDIAELHAALTRLKLDIDEEDISRKRLGKSTIRGIKQIQKRNKLAAHGKLDEGTLKALNDELLDVHYATSKTRTARLHTLLSKLELPMSSEETKGRILKDTTRRAIETFQKSIGLPRDGKVSEVLVDKLREAVIKNTYTTKTQIGNLHKTVLRAATIAGLKVKISAAELKSKRLGASTSQALKALQGKYKLPQTGKLDWATLEKIQSVAVSRGTPRRLLKKVDPRSLSVVSGELRLNMVSAKIVNLQKALTHAGYPVSDAEFKTQTFGKTTRSAVLAFQKANNLQETGHADKATIRLLNKEIEKANPGAMASYLKCRVRGSVRDELWQRKGKMVIKIYEKTLEGEEPLPMATSKNFLNGFFDITYNPPVDVTTGKMKDPYHVIVKLCEPVGNNPANDRVIESQTRYNVSRILWVNFTLGSVKYKGESEYAFLITRLKKPLGGTKPEDVMETRQNRQVTYLSQQAKLTTDDVMQVILSHRIAKQINRLDVIDGEVCYAYICQNLPAGLPGDLLRSTDNWTTIDQLTENASSGIVFTNDDLLKRVLENALTQNLVSRRVYQQKHAILQVLKDKRKEFALHKPILVGNATLKSLLDTSAVDPGKHSLIADTFIATKGINSQFWSELDKESAAIGVDKLGDLKTVISLGNMTKNHIPALTLFRDNIGEAADKQFKRASDVAKKEVHDLERMLSADPAFVPSSMPGASVSKKAANYAAAIHARAEALFPGVALVAHIKRGVRKPANIDVVEEIVDQYPSLDLKKENADKFLADKKDDMEKRNITITDAVKADFKMVQRTCKLSSTAASGAALIDLGLHSSMQIYFEGKDTLRRRFIDKGLDDKLADRIYETARMQYAQIWSRLLNFRPEFSSGLPAAITPQTYSKEEVTAWLGDIPDLEALFGSLDFCDCQHCRSLYGPAAYLTDILRYLGEHSSLIPQKTVKDILLDRRPDLARIKLNCENTNTPLPYIDLVCEILENYVAAGDLDFSYQSTLSAKELRAMPEYVRPEAYVTLSNADYPMNPVFNLWQEEARTNLAFLRTPRYEIMERFRNISDPGKKVPDDATIAAEYFGLSSYEADLIVKPRETEAEQDTYWGFRNENWKFRNADKTEVFVNDILGRTKLTYYQLLELLQVRFINGDPDDANRSTVVRPPDTCDTKVQYVNNLTWQKFARMHRFIRLWRKTGWEMWELDLLIRNPKVGRNKIDGNTLANLKRFKQLQEKLSLHFEVVLTFYGNINGEERTKPDEPDVKIQPLYLRLFQNKTITNPLDDKFKIKETLTLKSIDNLHLANEMQSLDPPGGYTPVPTILSALAIKQSDFSILEGKTDHHLSLATLSMLLRYTYLARGLKLTIEELVLLTDINNLLNPFDSPQNTLDFIADFENITASGLSLRELDYVLNYNEESPAGLRSDVYRLLLESIRKALITANDNINKLQLPLALQKQILDIVPDELTAKTDADVEAVVKPLADLLTHAYAAIAAAGIPTADIDFITHFDFNAVPFNSADKANLSLSIRQLQKNLGDLTQQGVNSVNSILAASFSLTDEQSKLLSTQLKLKGKALADILTDSGLLKKDAAALDFSAINGTHYPDQFAALLLLHKVSLLVQKMKIETKDLTWFVANGNAVRSLDFATLPLSDSAAPNHFSEWLNMYKFLSFKAAFPEPEDASLRAVLDAAIAAPDAVDDSKTIELLSVISKLTRWKVSDLERIHAGFMIKHVQVQRDYANAELYKRLQKCFDQIKLTGVSVATMFAWADRETAEAQQSICSQTRQAVKTKYENETWLEKITPLQNDLREKKRLALVNYIIEDSMRRQRETIAGTTDPNPLFWKDSAALYQYFLIDVEMSACQLTSRIKQAISSVQMFVQRCFLNLENRYVRVTEEQKEDKSSPNAWSQWKWMKNYRIWEANRKIFFYPENWIDPELRDDKSSFFNEMENELLQNEITAENVEAAFLNYLHKVDEVSHLEVCGLYHEMDDLDPSELGYERDIVHVIGRTKSVIPHTYFYRQYDMNYQTWTAWERIEVDITGDHVVPVIFNRKLHLFWLVAQQKQMKVHKNPPAQPTSGPEDTPEPPKYWEIQLGWSVRRYNGWSSKKISKQKLIHPWERPLSSYNLRPYYYVAENQLYLDVYLSTSRNFNDAYFYDQYYDTKLKQTVNPFNEMFKPWHSSSFLFDGEVKSIELKSLLRQYIVDAKKNDDGTLRIIEAASNSFEYVHDKFGEDGDAITQMLPVQFGPRLSLPDGMHYWYTQLTNNTHDAPNMNNMNVLEKANPTALLATSTLFSNTSHPFSVVITQQDKQFNAADHPFFYQDNTRAFFVRPEWSQILNNYNQVVGVNHDYHFSPFYHPYTVLFMRELNRTGLEGLLNRKIQMVPHTFAPVNNFDFYSYRPGASVTIDKDNKGTPIRRDIVDFSFNGAYSIYNWELFFHAPLMIACSLSRNQRFEEAMQWFHHIFDPTNIENLPSPQRYWITKPFYEFNSGDYRRQRIEYILSNIDLPEYQGQLKAWKNNPFKPHLIARFRPVAYQKTVVMKYLDNLIAWGDMLFRRDTIEAINEAALLYMLAYEILGRRPIKVPNVEHDDYTYKELEQKVIDNIGNTRVDVVIEDTLLPIKVEPSSSGTEPMPKLDTLYFCIPANEKLFSYWDTVEDRLFKIRNCMNIEGVVRQLPLFEPPIDPALLVKAAAAGLDLGSVLNDISAGAPPYRFRVVLQKAIEFCSEARVLGEKLLVALEKKDAEKLAALRSQHEIRLLEAIKEVRKKQIDEAVQTLGSLYKAQEMAAEKRNYFTSREFMNSEETASAVLNIVSSGVQLVGGVLELISACLSNVPDYYVGAAGFGGSPVAVTHIAGGNKISSGLQAAARALNVTSGILDRTSNLVATIGGYQRRKDEWDYQGRLAAIEISQLQFQINAAEIRQAIAEKELENQELQIENAKVIDEYVRNKYSNEQLYNWMITQISTVYFQAYRLAYDMAKKAEKCYQRELGIDNSSFIQFGYWDSMKKGLLSADKLATDLRRLEAAYTGNNERELEITKHISLAQMFPLSLITLRETGKCDLLSLPEWLFDMDYPGHYMRRIKSVAISIPCIAGPYTGVNCTLSLLRSEIRVDPDPASQYAKMEDDRRFRVQYGAIHSIATSHAQNDNGMFELTFNDDRYLPFEGEGAVSDWQISMPRETNYFDFGSISDVILHINYTARNGGSLLGKAAYDDLQTKLPESCARLFSLKHEFPAEWYKFCHPGSGADQEFVMNLKAEHYPFFTRGKLSSLKLKRLDIFIESRQGKAFVSNELKIADVDLTPDPQESITIAEDSTYEEAVYAEAQSMGGKIYHLRSSDFSDDLLSAGANPLGEVRFKLKLDGAGDYRSLTDDKIDNMFLLFQLG